jgi:hypothetical protein
VLDDELYVAQPVSDTAGDYAVFSSNQVENAPQYHVFKGRHATADDDRDETTCGSAQHPLHTMRRA